MSAPDPKMEQHAAAEAVRAPSPKTNHLLHQKSPYLLLHVHNPVDWYPWDEEAFAKARREHKPIFLSIGYYTCHWCHVMERESFSDADIAEILNRSFVSIKVDREERPDVDRMYMTFVQATTGSGGWPMSAFLTPELKPFLGGTYFPKEDAYGRVGFRTLLLRIAEAWQKNQANILQSADQVTEELEKLASVEPGDPSTLEQSVLDMTYRQLQSAYDPQLGGFARAPKFPRPVIFNFLLRYYARTRQSDALEMTLATLRAMARGGIHDHLGGGFHRYATDAEWHVPHFEKMLYDQAQLAISYLEAYQITHDEFFADTARDILDFVLRDLRLPEGGFYSALDADSLLEAGKPEHGEGAFYLWEAEQIEEALGGRTAAVFNFAYGVEANGNVAEAKDFQGEFKGKNILFARHSVAETARQFGRSESETRTTLDEAKRTLLTARSRRPHPPLDDKILSAWNGLMISAFARAAQVLEDTRYREAAERAAAFLHSKLYDPKTRILKRRYRAGDTAVDGFLDDYAFLIQGLVDLYEASFEVKWLAWAIQLQEKQDQVFWDSEKDGYSTTSGTDPALLIRTREDYDGAEPSPNSVTTMNLLRLSQMTDRTEWKEKATRTFAIFAERLKIYPEALPQLAAALDFSLSKPKQIIIAGRPDAPDTRALLHLVHERFLPNKILMVADGAAGQKQLSEWLPFIATVSRQQGRATAYICENYVCTLPSADPQVIAHLLDHRV